MITGFVLFQIVAVIGGVISVVALIRWIRDTRREISELPLEH